MAQAQRRVGEEYCPKRRRSRRSKKKERDHSGEECRLPHTCLWPFFDASVSGPCATDHKFIMYPCHGAVPHLLLTRTGLGKTSRNQGGLFLLNFWLFPSTPPLPRMTLTL